eukprot:TRINITY_DN2210_c1_g1_i5.p1 TRINITY_DN2210_c1_g1~~TRINITY_DN2210_c1_g1_i5.p1  ORF type:complete len:163 (+),score=53.16 TRINITY_DN2210_c1_g1_i5:589-1077(+)
MKKVGNTDRSEFRYQTAKERIHQNNVILAQRGEAVDLKSAKTLGRCKQVHEQWKSLMKEVELLEKTNEGLEKAHKEMAKAILKMEQLEERLDEEYQFRVEHEFFEWKMAQQQKNFFYEQLKKEKHDAFLAAEKEKERQLEAQKLEEERRKQWVEEQKRQEHV